MKCLVCGKKFDESAQTFCPICGFAAVSVVGVETDGQRAEIIKTAENYRKSRVGDIELMIVGYEWAANDQEILELAQKHYLPFEKCANMKLGVVYWINEAFARIPGNGTAEVTLGIKKGNDDIKDVKMNIPIPAGEDFWHIGVSLEEGLKVQLHLKTGKEEKVSELISLV